MYEIVFVILHYLTLNDTIDCVDSIRKNCRNERYKIIIVDNASFNDSSFLLKKEYKEAVDVDLIYLQKNLGFAKGNNEGIIAARERYSPDYIVVMNNDVVLLQENTVQIIRDEFQNSCFSVLGPMIYTADGRCNDNPGRNVPMSLEEINKTIKEAKKCVFLFKWHLWKMYRLVEIFKQKLHINNNSVITQTNERINYLDKAKNVQLHGCFLCFSREYFKIYNGFFSDTFLYLEEDILFYLTQKKNLTTIYMPLLHVFHKEDSASKACWSSDRERALRKAQYVLESAINFKRLYKND